jgi:hypothetical protein
LVANREDDNPTSTTRGTLRLEDNGKAIEDKRFRVLKAHATELMIKSSGRQIRCNHCKACVIAKVSVLDQSRCKKWKDVKSLTETILAHDESTGCKRKNGFSLFYGFDTSLPGRHNTYRSGSSHTDFYQNCDGSSGAKSEGEFQYASLYMRNDPSMDPALLGLLSVDQVINRVRPVACALHMVYISNRESLPPLDYIRTPGKRAAPARTLRI